MMSGVRQGLVLVVALAGAFAFAADTAALHSAIQGRWRADNKSVAEQVPGWKGMTAKQRETVLAVIPPLNFEITADHVILKATSPDDQDEPLAYTITGAEGQSLKLIGKDQSGETKPFTIEVLGADALKMTSTEGPALRLDRVPPGQPSPSPSPSPR
jgi:hypothetical protein